jgi:hypothetical protein
MPVLELHSVRDTTLWKRLDGTFSGPDGELAKKLAVYVSDSCTVAYDRMRNFANYCPQYTLHDEVHLLRVTELMAKVMPNSVADLLNPVEIALLILAANFHDQGMVLEGADFDALPTNEEFRRFQDNWIIEHPNFTEVRQHLNDRNLSAQEQQRLRDTENELQAALRTDFIRITHGERSADFVRTKYASDTSWTVAGTNVAEFVARLCLSHVRPASDLISADGFRFDETVGTYKINMPYLGLVLRLADILDLDRDRTPDSLYRTINFRSGVSLREWEKHRSVDGWTIEPTLVQFTMRCEHPEYQRAAYQFMDWIDKELADAQRMIRTFPYSSSSYGIDLPLAVDRSRIEPKDNAYIYHDLEFSLSRDEIVKLLMTNKLYGAPWLCVRELLQNAMDALRHRHALIKRDNATDWDHGKVEMVHELDADGHELLHVTDNGAGMDSDIIERFLTKVGRSYYRSPEFEQERASFRAAGVDFDPCAQFGIGFMSCFMLGDHITIRTRRDYGPNKGLGEPYTVEINGLGGIVVIREGSDDQPTGTTVTIRGRRKPTFVDEFEDNVKLLEVVEGYALACEFPIDLKCTIPEIEGAAIVEPEFEVPRTSIEEFPELKKLITLRQNFAEVHPLLNGCLTASFIVDDDGQLTLANSEANWRVVTEGNLKHVELVSSDGKSIERYFPRRENQLCIDGLLVAGEPGREASGHNRRFNTIGSQGSPFDAGRALFLLDIRGDLKAPLTPARTLPEWALRGLGPRWAKISRLLNRAIGKLWHQVASRPGLSPASLWQLATIYSELKTAIPWITAGAIWSLVSLPVIRADEANEWRQISSLGKLSVVATSDKESDGFQLVCVDGARIGLNDELARWREAHIDALRRELKYLAINMSTVIIDGSTALLELRPPLQHDIAPNEYFVGGGSHSVSALPYSSELQDFVSIHLPYRNVNRSHPVIAEVLDSKYLEQPSPFQIFAQTLSHFLSDPEALQIIVDSTQQVTRWHKAVGGKYLDVDWQTVATNLHPPYKVRLMDGTTTSVTADHLQTWALARDYKKF